MDLTIRKVEQLHIDQGKIVVSGVGHIEDALYESAETFDEAYYRTITITTQSQKLEIMLKADDKATLLTKTVEQ